MCLSQQTRDCHDKTHLLSQQECACHDKTFDMTKLCLSRQNIFVVTSILLLQQKTSRQKLYLWQLPTMIVSHISQRALYASSNPSFWQICLCTRVQQPEQVLGQLTFNCKTRRIKPHDYFSCQQLGPVAQVLGLRLTFQPDAGIQMLIKHVIYLALKKHLVTQSTLCMIFLMYTCNSRTTFKQDRSRIEKTQFAFIFWHTCDPETRSRSSTLYETVDPKWVTIMQSLKNLAFTVSERRLIFFSNQETHQFSYLPSGVFMTQIKPYKVYHVLKQRNIFNQNCLMLLCWQLWS